MFRLLVINEAEKRKNFFLQQNLVIIKINNRFKFVKENNNLNLKK
jgi:hypothetical protein